MPVSYKYNRDTGEHCGTGTYIINYHKDDIINSYETKTEPPNVGGNQVARYLDPDGYTPTHHGVNEAVWVICLCFIGTTYYDQDGTENTITDYDIEVPDDCLIIPPPNKYYKTHDGTDWIYERTDHIEDRINEVKTLLTEKYAVDATYTYGSTAYGWQVDKDSQDNIVVGANVAIMSSIDTVNFPWEGDDTKWCSSDNTMVTFTTPLDFLQFAKAIQVHCRALWKNAKIHKTAIRLLTDETDINNYDIATGW